MYGCRVVQKALEVCDMDQKKVMALEIKDYFMKLVQDQNGNHVIQKIIEHMGKEEDIVKYLINAFHNNAYSLSVHA